jgi:hypothetical protein
LCRGWGDSHHSVPPLLKRRITPVWRYFSFTCSTYSFCARWRFLEGTATWTCRFRITAEGEVL